MYLDDSAGGRRFFACGGEFLFISTDSDNSRSALCQKDSGCSPDTAARSRDDCYFAVHLYQPSCGVNFTKNSNHRARMPTPGRGKVAAPKNRESHLTVEDAKPDSAQ